MDQTFDFGLLNTQKDPRFAQRKYGRFGTIAKNGCGLIALYNIERAADPETRFDPYYDARNTIKTNLFGLLGTRMSAIRKKLESKGFQVFDVFLGSATPYIAGSEIPMHADKVAALASALSSGSFVLNPAANAAPAIARFSASIAGTRRPSKPLDAREARMTGKAKECVPVEIMIGVRAAIIPTAIKPK